MKLINYTKPSIVITSMEKQDVVTASGTEYGAAWNWDNWQEGGD